LDLGLSSGELTSGKFLACEGVFHLLELGCLLGVEKATFVLGFRVRLFVAGCFGPDRRFCARVTFIGPAIVENESFYLEPFLECDAAAVL